MWPYGDGQHGSLGSHLEKFQGMCFEYKESVTWTGGMVPVLEPSGSGLETAEERCHLARVLIFSQLATGEGVQPSALDLAGGGGGVSLSTVSRSIFGTKFTGTPVAIRMVVGLWCHATSSA